MNRSDLDRNAYMLCGPLAKRGYLRWWHSFTGKSLATGEVRTFFVEYLILNPVPGKKREGSVPSYVRISAGAFPSESSPAVQLHSCYPIRAAKFARKPLYFQVAENVLQENRITGSLDVSPKEAAAAPYLQPATMEWDLEIYKSIACHTGLLASPLLCALNALDSFWHGEGIKTHYRGSVTLNEEEFEVTADECNGYADKHWGRDFNNPWLQLASCHLVSERTGKLLKHSALAIDGCCPRFLFFRLKPRMLLQLTYTGEDFCFSFARPFSLSRLKWGTKERRDSFTWHVKAQNRTALLKLSIHSPKGRMMALPYERPEGDLQNASSPRLYAGADGRGTIDLYRVTPQGPVWLDTLTIQNALCFIEKPSKTASAR
ncbi:MAG: hypothetical protein J5546_07350 [Lachnospiraceae bacterium]|nr:hypothetical protein [Lachnospiraceae bacterium]